MTELNKSDSSNKPVSAEHKVEQVPVVSDSKNQERRDRLKKKKEESEKARKAFPMLTYKHHVYHPFALDTLSEIIKRRPEGVSVETIMELFIQKTTSSQYLHLIRKRVPRKHFNGGAAEDILDEEVAFAKFLLSEKYKDKHGVSMEEDNAKKVVRKRRPKNVDPKTGIIIKEKKVVKRKKRENRTASTPEYREAHKDKNESESVLSEQLKKLKK